jgi:hypothetical protein
MQQDQLLLLEVRKAGWGVQQQQQRWLSWRSSAAKSTARKMLR